jgi:hypothetical protein
VAAENGVVGDYPLTDNEPLDAVTHGVDPTDDLVARGQRVLREEATLVDVEIRTAHAGQLDGETDLPGAGLRCRKRRYLENARGAVDDGSHVSEAETRGRERIRLFVSRRQP